MVPTYPGHLPFVVSAANGFPELDSGSIHRACESSPLKRLSHQVGQAYESAPAHVAGILEPAKTIVREMELTLAAMRAIVAKAAADFPPTPEVPVEESQAEAPVKAKSKTNARQA